MSLRTLRIPGMKLGLGSIISNDVDDKRQVIYHGLHVWSAASVSHQFTQGQTKMATINAILLTKSIYAAKASASVWFHSGTISGGTVTIRLKPKAAGANTNNSALGLHYWISGTPDPNRIVI